MPAQPAVSVWLFAHEKPAHMVIINSQAWELHGYPAVHRIAPGQAVYIRTLAGRVEASWEKGRDAAATWRMRSAGTWTLQAAGRTLTGSGELHVSSQSRGLTPRLRVPAEPYLAGVMAAEFNSETPAALEAMAVCVRSFTRRALQAPRHGAADTCDATHCQRFRPQERPSAAILTALQNTRGHYRVWRNEAAQTLWHAACGGWRSSAFEAFQRQHVPYLSGGSDMGPSGRAWCDAPPGRWHWQAEVSRQQWQTGLLRAGLDAGAGHAPTLRVVTRGPSGRVTRIQWGTSPAQTLEGQKFWETLGPVVGWNGLRSLRFEVSETPRGWRFSGTGLGHGVGLCQAGAEARARAGWSREAILSAYFPETRSVYSAEIP